ncbi:MAG: amino acid racemase, partial [Bacteroidota bacterium]|nr:amino acid racemase [Bacteroidota bacterium]
MNRIGLIGGMGPEATLDYYKRIIDAFKNGKNDFNYPEIILYSINLSLFMAFMRKGEYDKATDYLVEKIEDLRKAGATFAALSANTPHLLFDRIRSKTNLPLISIIEATCEECITRGVKRPGLIGTGYTMNGTLFQDVFTKHDIEVIVPEKQDREWVNHKLFTEIELGVFKDETRQGLIRVTEKMIREQKIDSLILGCTEFPLILTEPEYAGIPMLNTTQIHVDAIVKYCK